MNQPLKQPQPTTSRTMNQHLRRTATSIILAGLLLTLTGSNLQGQDTFVWSGAAGNSVWNDAGNWTNTTTGGGTDTDGIPDANDTATFSANALAEGGSAADLVIDPAVTFSIGRSTTTIGNSISNSGTLTFAGTPSNVTNEILSISGNVSLSGGGEVVLVETNDSVIVNAGATTGSLTNIDNTIRGSGSIDVDLINEAAGRVEIAVGDLLTIRDVTGGTINGETGAVFGGNGVFRDLTFTGSLAATTTATPTLQGAIDNRGTLTFAGTPLNATNESLLISGDVLLSGGGEIVLVEANDSVIASTTAIPDSVLTNVDNTIRGQGAINVELINESLIRAEGGTLTLDSAVDNVTGNIEIAADGRLQNSTSITGGVVTAEAGSILVGSTGIYQDVAFAGTATFGLGSTTFAGSIGNSGTLTFAGTPLNGTNESLLISGDVLLSGGGEIVLVEANDSVIANAGATPGTLTNVDNTIRGAGQIQSLTLNNQSTIRAEGGEVTFTGVDFTQTAGRLEVAEDGVLRASQELLILDGQVGGTGIIIGDIRNQGGTINAGDLLGTTGTLALEGDLFHETDSTLSFDIGLPDASQFDLLDIDGGLELLGGGLEVSLISGDFLIPESTRIDIVLASDGISGTLDSVLLPTDSLGNALFSVDVDSAGIISLVALQDIQGVAIPEPSSAGICLITGILLTVRRRRIA